MIAPRGTSPRRLLRAAGVVAAAARDARRVGASDLVVDDAPAETRAELHRRAVKAVCARIEETRATTRGEAEAEVERVFAATHLVRGLRARRRSAASGARRDGAEHRPHELVVVPLSVAAVRANRNR